MQYILFNTNKIFLKNNIKNNKSTNIFLLQKHCYYLIIHLKFSTIFFSSQLCDMAGYETPVTLNIKNTSARSKFFKKIVNMRNSVIIYNFHIIFNQQRIFITTLQNGSVFYNKNFNNSGNLNSITELFANANWLERENSELHGIFFCGKKDLRNLLLQYGDSTTPMIKSFPSIGTREISYDSISDALIQVPTSIQF